MDAKITKLRLSRMLSYDWLKIIGTAAAAIVVWVLIFTMTATRITSAQTFTLCNYVGNVSLDTEFINEFYKARKDGVFTGEVLEQGVVDLPTNGEYASQVLQARVATEEGDVMFVSTQPDKATKYEEPVLNPETGEAVLDPETGKPMKETKYTATYLQTFLSGYRFDLHNLSLTSENGYFKQMENYLNRYYTDYQNADSLNEEKVEEAFLARIKRTKDKRYKKQAQIQKGVDEAIERMQKYREALLSFYKYLDEGVIALTETTYKQEGAYGFEFTGTYSINLCPNEKMSKLSKYVCYAVEYEDENGDTQITTTAQDMNVCLFNMNGKEEEFRYEGLLYITHLIDSVLKMQ